MSSYVARAQLNASDTTAQGLTDILSHPNLPASGAKRFSNQIMLTRGVSPCLSPVAPVGGNYHGYNTSMVLSQDAIPQMDTSMPFSKIASDEVTSL